MKKHWGSAEATLYKSVGTEWSCSLSVFCWSRCLLWVFEGDSSELRWRWKEVCVSLKMTLSFAALKFVFCELFGAISCSSRSFFLSETNCWSFFFFLVCFVHTSPNFFLSSVTKQKARFNLTAALFVVEAVSEICIRQYEFWDVMREKHNLAMFLEGRERVKTNRGQALRNFI